jgi:hypothetical protein
VAETNKNIDLVTFKITPEDADWAAAEQRKLKRAERRSVTQADFFSRMRAVWRKHSGEAQGTPAPMGSEGNAESVPEALARIEQALKELLGEGSQDYSNAGTIAEAGGRGALIRLIEAVEEGARRTAENNQKTGAALDLLQRLVEKDVATRRPRSA